jgi:hypothetical protein
MSNDKTWRLVTLAVAAGMAGGFLAVQLVVGEPGIARASGPKVVTANEFRVVNSDGITVAVWTSGAQGARILFGSDPKRPAAVFGTLENGDPGVSLFGRDGALRADFRVGTRNFPTLRLTDTKGKKTTLLGAHGMGLFNKRLRGRFVLTSEGNLTVDVADQDTRLSTALLLAAKGKSALSVNDQAGKTLWSAP